MADPFNEYGYGKVGGQEITGVLIRDAKHPDTLVPHIAFLFRTDGEECPAAVMPLEMAETFRDSLSEAIERAHAEHWE